MLYIWFQNSNLHIVVVVVVVVVVAAVVVVVVIVRTKIALICCVKFLEIVQKCFTIQNREKL